MCSVLTSEKLRIGGRGVWYNSIQFKFLRRRKDAILQFTLLYASLQGPLAKEVPGEQVKQLVRALFQNTERRAALLAKIK